VLGSFSLRSLWLSSSFVVSVEKRWSIFRDLRFILFSTFLLPLVLFWGLCPLASLHYSYALCSCRSSLPGGSTRVHYYLVGDVVAYCSSSGGQSDALGRMRPPLSVSGGHCQ